MSSCGQSQTTAAAPGSAPGSAAGSSLGSPDLRVLNNILDELAMGQDNCQGSAAASKEDDEPPYTASSDPEADGGLKSSESAANAAKCPIPPSCECDELETQNKNNVGLALSLAVRSIRAGGDHPTPTQPVSVRFIRMFAAFLTLLVCIYNVVYD
ncbi:hypothetical protein LSTR_LSTR004936 [Laodelphax striatellus]|uniref:Uncharacterized protein n=1 Tax=Laodelphax striatellus TaxID=195883 RepID=A0A482XND7_LAOST|nr:hypothetical protein LSTR_LSTR004936 [Laodelphax striatellus]